MGRDHYGPAFQSSRSSSPRGPIKSSARLAVGTGSQWRHQSPGYELRPELSAKQTYNYVYEPLFIHRPLRLCWATGSFPGIRIVAAVTGGGRGEEGPRRPWKLGVSTAPRDVGSVGWCDLRGEI